MNFNKLTKALAFIIIAEATGAAGSIFTTRAIPVWYPTLNKPAFSPPNFIFAPVWTTLYFLMGIAAYLVFEKGFAKKEVKFALLVFALQLILNVLWSFVFFGLKSPGLAFLEIIILWVSILATTLAFYKISKPASYLLIPYLLWTTFAAFLNFAIFRLN